GVKLRDRFCRHTFWDLGSLVRCVAAQILCQLAEPVEAEQAFDALSNLCAHVSFRIYSRGLAIEEKESRERRWQKSSRNPVPVPALWVLLTSTWPNDSSSDVLKDSQLFDSVTTC